MLAIVITAYNRPEPLRTLLNGLLHVRTNDNTIPLIISIDNGGTQEVNQIANDYKWPYGEKKVIVHEEKLGLVKHFIWTGDQTEQYENVIFLEDDLLPSPEMINYTIQMIDFYKNDDQIAAGSLYNPVINESTGTKFYQIEDGFDAYFLQQPYWGHVWMKDKWTKFKEYLNTYTEKKDILPPHVGVWTQSFKKIYIQFLIETNRTVVTPRLSVVTNNGQAGLHSGDLYYCQSNLLIEDKVFRFPSINSFAVSYDSFFEISSELIKHYNSDLINYDFEMDLNGTKKTYNSNYVLTTRSVSSFIYKYSCLMKPTELGIVMKANGDGIYLAKKEDVIFDKSYEQNRRYKDIKKNYYIGFFASFKITKYFVKLLFRRLFVKNKKAK